MTDDPLTPDPEWSPQQIAEFEALKADLLVEPGIETALRDQLYEESVAFLSLCVLAAKRIQMMDDVWRARRIMAEVTVWAKELKERMVKETTALQRPKNTAGAFKR